MAAPPTPPPMITTRARSGSWRGPRHAVRQQTVEVPGSVGLEIEVERRDDTLDDAPRRLSGV